MNEQGQTETRSQESQQVHQAAWQTLIIEQLAQVEAMLQRVDATLKTQLAKSKDQLEEMNKLTASAIGWVADLQKGAINLSLATLKTASEAIQKVRA